MLVLGLDTSSSAASVAIGNEEKLLGEIIIDHTKTHSQKLMPIINQLLQNLDLDIKDIELIGISNGPGSFTGVRIGVSAAKGLAQPYDIPMVQVSTLYSMGYNLFEIPGYICPIFDARRNQVYTMVLKWNNGKLETVFSEEAIVMEELIEKLKTLEDRITFLGDGVFRHKEFIKEKLGSSAKFANSIDNMQKASSIIMASLSENPANYLKYSDIDANYLRKSEAERNYEKKQAK